MFAPRRRRGKPDTVSRVVALEQEVDAVAAETGFSGVVRVDRGDEIVVAKAYGWAHRGWEIPNAVDTRFATASAAKGFTALAVVSLVQEGVLELSTTARSLLGEDLPLVADDVTIEQLLAHRSGIGDYLDEDADVDLDLDAYLMPVPVHELAETEQYLRVIDGFPTKFVAGERFSYSNGGYVVLALLAERASGVPYHDLVRQRVTEPAGLRDTEFLRSDELPGRTALGYLAADGLRTNVLHLPVRGVGDGGIYTTAADMRAFWTSFLAGRIVAHEWVVEMSRPRSDAPELAKRYGLGLWLRESTGTVLLEGMDTGASFRSCHDPVGDVTHTVLSNTAEGAWPVTRLLAERLGV